jgi:hypothetical protein
MAGKGSHGRIDIGTEVRGVGGGGGSRVFSEFRLYEIPYVFFIPYILYSTYTECPKFRGIPYYGICQILRNSATFGVTKFHIILTSGG